MIILEFTIEQVLKVLENAGVDTSCGECCCIAFTGNSSGANHTCKNKNSTKEINIEILQ